MKEALTPHDAARRLPTIVASVFGSLALFYGYLAWNSFLWSPGWAIRYAGSDAERPAFLTAPPNAAQANSEAGPVARGRTVYLRSGCAICHGLDGKGGIRNPNAQTDEEIPSLVYVAEGYTPEELKDRIRRGVADIARMNPEGPPPPLTMPSWHERLSAQQVEDLVAFLISLMPKEAKEIW